MRILIPVSTFERAGGFRVLSELATHWTRAGHKVDFLVDYRSAPPYFPTRGGLLRFDSAGQLFFDIKPGKPFAPSGNAKSIYWGMFRALNRVGRNYDVILANHSFTALPVTLARTGSAQKWYYIQAYEPEYHSFDKGWRGKILKTVSAFSYRLPLQQLVNAPLYLDYRSIRAKDWIPPGLDLEVFTRRVTAPDFVPGTGITLGTIGRHELTKGTVDVLKAFEILAERDPNIRLHIAYGNLPPGWQHPRATVTEPLGDVGLAKYYRSVDILIAAGTVQHGACHYPVLEAMASGTPVITTGYLPASERNAWLVPTNSPVAIADAVNKVIGASSADRMVKLDAAVAAIASFEWASVSQHFLKLFAERLRLSRS